MSDQSPVTNNPESQRCWARVIVLAEHIDKLKERFSEPRPSHVDDLIVLFEHRLVREIQKLRDLDD